VTLLAIVLPSLLLACAEEPLPPPVHPTAPVNVSMPPTIVTTKDVGSEDDLRKKGEKAILEQKWQDAVDAYKALLAADPNGPHAGEYMFALASAQEGLQDRAAARDSFLRLASKFPTAPTARVALLRAATLDAFLEDWPALAAIGDAILARQDLNDLDRMVGLGARALANVELGKGTLAAKDINDGLDLADQHHYGGTGDLLPVAVAQLRFAQAESFRMKSEQIHFVPLPPNFVEMLEARCGWILQAQDAYAIAVRSVDAHWASMAGYRVGAMYRSLHTDLMEIPPPNT
jgi:hypothetical protein